MGSRVEETDLESSSEHVLLTLRRDRGTTEVLPEPTWVFENGPDEPVVVWTSPSTDDPVLTVEDSSEPPWKLVLRLWRRYRGFSDLEKALVVAELSEQLTEESRRELAELLDLPASEPLFSALKNIYEYPEKFRDKLHDGDVGLRLLRYLDLFPERIRSVLVDGFRDGTMDLSVQEIRQLEEAVRRLTDEQKKDWIERATDRDTEENAREAGRALLAMTRDMAYPTTRERRERFRATLESLDVDGRITITPPENFEGDYLDIKFRCRRNENLIRLAEEIKRCKKLLKHL